MRTIFRAAATDTGPSFTLHRHIERFGGKRQKLAHVISTLLPEFLALPLYLELEMTWSVAASSASQPLPASEHAHTLLSRDPWIGGMPHGEASRGVRCEVWSSIPRERALELVCRGVWPSPQGSLERGMEWVWPRGDGAWSLSMGVSRRGSGAWPALQTPNGGYPAPLQGTPFLRVPASLSATMLGFSASVRVCPTAHTQETGALLAGNISRPALGVPLVQPGQRHP